MNAAPVRTLCQYLSENMPKVSADNDDDSIAVVVEYDENASKLIARLRAGDMKVKRKLQRYSVPVPKKYINELMKSGLISECNGVCLLANKNYYTDEMGLDINTDLDAQNIV